MAWCFCQRPGALAAAKRLGAGRQAHPSCGHEAGNLFALAVSASHPLCWPVLESFLLCGSLYMQPPCQGTGCYISCQVGNEQPGCFPAMSCSNRISVGGQLIKFVPRVTLRSWAPGTEEHRIYVSPTVCAFHRQTEGSNPRRTVSFMADWSLILESTEFT